MKKTTPLLAGSALLLSSCTGVRSSFDCDATTSDTCMTMTRTNQLARDKTARQVGKPAADGLPSLANLPATSAVGVPSASRSAVSPPPGTWAVSATPPVSADMSAGVSTDTTTSTLTSRPVAETSITTTPPSVVYRPIVSVVTPTPSCQNVRCDNSGSAHPQCSQDQVAAVWIVPQVDSDSASHQPSRVSFVISPADWILPARVN